MEQLDKRSKLFGNDNDLNAEPKIGSVSRAVLSTPETIEIVRATQKSEALVIEASFVVRTASEAAEMFVYDPELARLCGNTLEKLQHTAQLGADAYALPPPSKTLNSDWDAATFDQQIRAAVGRCGGESYVFISCAQTPEGYEYFRYLVGCSPRWFQLYEARHGYLTDPLLAHAKQSSSPILGDALSRSALSAGQCDVFKLAQQFGFESLIALPSHGPSAQRVGVLLVGAARPAQEGEPTLWKSAATLRLLSLEMLEWSTRNARARFIERYSIDEHDIAVMQHSHQGVTSTDIALMMNSTARAVDERFRRLCARLQAPNRKAAVTMAYLHGLVV